MFKNFVLLCLLNLILCQQQQQPLPSPSFGRVFNNPIKARNSFFDGSVSVCSNPGSYGFIQRAGTNKYYATADIQMNWIDAENYCQSFNAHLPVASSETDINFFRWFVGGKFMKPSYRINNGYKINTWSGYWLGIYKSLETNSWRWIDNSPLIYEDWDKTWPDDTSTDPQPTNGLELFGFDYYDLTQKKHRGWHDVFMLYFNIVLCELKC